MIESEGWVKLDGGEVLPSQKIESVRFRDGTEMDLGELVPRENNWKHHGGDSDIVAYRLSNEHDEPAAKADPLLVQVGGGHYKKLKIQPVEYILANGLGFCEGSVIKYVTRHEEKGGVQDLRKAIHFLEILISDIEKRNVSS